MAVRGVYRVLSSPSHGALFHKVFGVPTYLKISAGLGACSWILESSQDFLHFKSEVYVLTPNTLIPHCWWEVSEEQRCPLPNQSPKSFLLKYPSAALNAAREQTTLKRHFHNLTSCCFATHVINPSSFPLLDARHSEQDVFHLPLKASQVTTKRPAPPLPV